MKSLGFVLLLPIALTGCSSGGSGWHGTNITGSVPSLAFDMKRADTGANVDGEDFRGDVTALYFGYTYCPDICPMTLSNMGRALQRMGDAAKNVRVLFVTVDPRRDTPAEVEKYVKAFGPQFVGLTGSEDQLARVAKRYRVAYSVSPDPDPAKYEVTHSSALFIFDRHGEARLLENSLSTDKPDIAGVADDLTRLVREKD
ncbi:SCO family protein [Stakelama pacifica]|uniref:Protein SCO1/2 n=1 Tax=Stakelama pacifica TaxID=517720 RepID=A0A4R6FRS6_9SPHN|nr:SCO family protein [Stakelama pacifica]TDN84469.1 protein SCO1/2 [Stakelama pacifica]GGO93716.1 photosynthetic protein synthase I [Stakelama pacifica]